MLKVFLLILLVLVVSIISLTCLTELILNLKNHRYTLKHKLKKPVNQFMLLIVMSGIVIDFCSGLKLYHMHQTYEATQARDAKQAKAQDQKQHRVNCYWIHQRNHAYAEMKAHSKNNSEYRYWSAEVKLAEAKLRDNGYYDNTTYIYVDR